MRRAWHALAAYFVITLVATWPLARGLGRNVAWDLGDSLLNMWILAWDCEQLLAILRGDVSRLATFFDANIFHPAPLSLAYSEHLIAQAVQVLPLYAVTHNPILVYNLLFLSTFVLSGLGMYLLVRELTGNALAGFVAGLLFAFAPYRIAQSSHLQVLSSQWMPFVIYGMRRYFDSAVRQSNPAVRPAAVAPGASASVAVEEPAQDDRSPRRPRLKPLLWASIALVAQALSSGYHLLYFTPFAAAYALWETAQRRLWRDRRVWLHLGAAAMLAGILVGPFLIPYAEVRVRFDMARTVTEVSRLSADVYSYATAFVGQPIWGRVMRALPKAEGELFPGVVPLVLALIGIVFFRLKPEATGARQLKATKGERQSQRRKQLLVLLLTLVAIAYAILAIVTIVVRRVSIDFGLFELQATDVTRLLLRSAVAFSLVLLLSRAARTLTAAFLRDRGFFLAGLIAAFWLSLGPSPQALGRPLDLVAPYRALYEYVPGFDGVRVPARFAMVVAFMLAVLGGYGAAWLARRKTGRGIVIAMAAAFLLESTAVPFLVNGMTPPKGFNAPEPRVYRPGRAPAIYAEVRRQAGDGVLAELPLGYPDFDLRAMYYSIVHWRPILNGYSGFYPPHYGRLAFALGELPRHPEVSLRALAAAGATHVLVHESAYIGSEGPGTSAALRMLGATEVYRDGSDVLLALPR